MNRWHWLLAIFAVLLVWQESSAQPILKRHKLQRVNLGLCGQVLDFTHNHGSDNRIWSAALHERRDLYVYLPPGFDPKKKYAMSYFLHGSNQDEQFFLNEPVHRFDQAIATGKLPPMILVVPDGSILGRPSFFRSPSFFANSRAGCFEDYLMNDVWNFMMENFPIRPEREAHGLIGVSMGGSAAFALAMNHKDRFKMAIGFAPALNLRWIDCHGKYFGKFDPECWGWRTQAFPLEVLGRPGNGLIKIRVCTLLGPLIGWDDDVAEVLSRVNPLEIMVRTNLKDRELDLFVAYGGCDEFNMDTQVESFLYVARERGITVGTAYDPCGKHDVATGARLFPEILRWLESITASKRLQPAD